MAVALRPPHRSPGATASRRWGIRECETSSYNRDMTPSPNGRTASGRFAKGNPGGPGNPHSRRVAALREALLESVTESDIRAVSKALVSKAKGGDIPAVRELLDRLLGKGDEKGREAPPIIRLITGVPDADDDET